MKPIYPIVAAVLALFLTACAQTRQDPPAPEHTASPAGMAEEGVDPEDLQEEAELLEQHAAPTANTADDPALEDILRSYYTGQETPVWAYFQKHSITRFLAGWVKEETGGEIPDPQWDYNTFTAIQILDHDFQVSREDEQLYACTFSDGDRRHGYIIVRYTEDGPGLGQWGVTETTPDIYDLRANLDGIAAGLARTDIDLATATASRVYYYDRDNRRADQVIRFTDGKEDNYLYYFGDLDYEIVKVG